MRQRDKKHRDDLCRCQLAVRAEVDQPRVYLRPLVLEKRGFGPAYFNKIPSELTTGLQPGDQNLCSPLGGQWRLLKAAQAGATASSEKSRQRSIICA